MSFLTVVQFRKETHHVGTQGRAVLIPTPSHFAGSRTRVTLVPDSTCEGKARYLGSRHRNII
jgi:hypothetical protein